MAGISGPHAAEFLLSLAGAGRVVYSRSWIEVPQRIHDGGVLRPCTAPDNAEILTEHESGIRGRLRLGTTARKKEEWWTARCEGGTLRVGPDGEAVLVENFGVTTSLPTSRLDVLESAGLADHRGLRDCPDDVFPALVFVALFARGSPTPGLDLMASCMELLS